VPAAGDLYGAGDRQELLITPFVNAPMHSQLYLCGRLIGNPELGRTKKGKLWVKVLLETQLVRETRPEEIQSESVVLPISFFSAPAESVKDLKAGDALTVGGHLYGSEFKTDFGTVKAWGADHCRPGLYPTF
jgi:single-stranded DNA-binding protein